MSTIYDIFKYQLNSYGGTFMDLPVGTKFLHAAEQHGNLCVWLKVPRTFDEKMSTIFEVKYTGDVAPNLKHLKTFFSDNDTIVNHLFASMRVV